MGHTCNEQYYECECNCGTLYLFPEFFWIEHLVNKPVQHCLLRCEIHDSLRVLLHLGQGLATRLNSAQCNQLQRLVCSTSNITTNTQRSRSNDINTNMSRNFMHMFYSLTMARNSLVTLRLFTISFALIATSLACPCALDRGWFNIIDAFGSAKRLPFCPKERIIAAVPYA